VYARGGSILPILNHEGCTAILACIDNSIRLEIYLDIDGKAKGSIYFDDGHSFKYQTETDASAFVVFEFDG